MTTLNDLAKLAQVNVSTISRYLSGELKVTPATEARIKDAISKTNYQPNLLARSLRRGKTDTVAVLVPDIYQTGISGIIAGIDKRISSSSKTLMILMTGNSRQRETDAILELCHRRIDGIIIVGKAFEGEESNQGIEALESAGIPRLLVSRNFAESNTVEIAPDQFDGAYQLTEHLIECGYRKIGLILGSRDHPGDMLKLAGYRQALQAHEMEYSRDLVIEGHYTTENINRIVSKLLDVSVDAIFCATDTMAISALQFVQFSGMSVPGDIAIAGYGGGGWPDMPIPNLTTVDVHIKQLGSTAGNLLLDIIDGKDDFIMLNITPVHLKVGTTT
jgi:DNA-binding LacI/PurR family transcriptional regulator